MKAQNLAKPETTRGFSLMELMVVIMILGILAVVVQKNVWPMLDRAKVNTAKTDIKTLADAIGFYKMNNNKLPESLELLVTPDPKNGNAAYLELESVPLDPWDNQYDYKPQGSKFEIICYGADGMQGGEGFDEDISSKALKK
jgi:general secretion pathway protein G